MITPLSAANATVHADKINAAVNVIEINFFITFLPPKNILVT